MEMNEHFQENVRWIPRKLEVLGMKIEVLEE